jgi:hypothetical protein
MRNDKTVPVNEHHTMKAWPHSEMSDGETNNVLKHLHTHTNPQHLTIFTVSTQDSSKAEGVLRSDLINYPFS